MSATFHWSACSSSWVWRLTGRTDGSSGPGTSGMDSLVLVALLRDVEVDRLRVDRAAVLLGDHAAGQRRSARRAGSRRRRRSARSGRPAAGSRSAASGRRTAPRRCARPRPAPGRRPGRRRPSVETSASGCRGRGRRRAARGRAGASELVGVAGHVSHAPGRGRPDGSSGPSSPARNCSNCLADLFAGRQRLVAGQQAGAAPPRPARRRRTAARGPAPPRRPPRWRRGSAPTSASVSSASARRPDRSMVSRPAISTCSSSAADASG